MGTLHKTAWGIVTAAILVLSGCSTSFSARDDAAEWAGAAAPAASPPARFRDLAGQIDHLEKRIDKYGSVVPQHANVWGQARMMMHRQEFERVMKQDLDFFKTFTLQGAIATSDQAFLAEAVGLQSAASAAAAKAPDVTTLVSGNDIISRDKLLATKDNTVLINGKLAIEPTLIEDQKRRFLNHLHELRRLNEGDDTTDAPGYALNLMSIPISVLTGDCTQTGYGAECTITATPHLTDDLLPKTFRDLVINDLVDLLTMQVTNVMEVIDEKNEGKYQALWHAVDNRDRMKAAGVDQVAETELESNTTSMKDILGPLFARSTSPGVSKHPGKLRSLAPSQVDPFIGLERVLVTALALRRQIDHRACTDKAYYLDVQGALRTELNAAYDFLSTEPARHFWELCSPALVQAVRSRDMKLFNSIHYQFFHMLHSGNTTPWKLTEKSFNTLLISRINPQGIRAGKDAGKAGGVGKIPLTDICVGKVPGEAACPDKVPAEVVNALCPLKDRTFPNADELADELRKRLTADELRCYQAAIWQAAAPTKLDEDPTNRAITDALAWTILLDAALLNDRFLEDMRDTHTGKGCGCAPPAWAPLYLPEPPPEARQLFNDYVRCRWPLHIFALDPETEDQNIADSFRLRRETQLALSLAFTSGKIGASSFTRYTRRIEQDLDTIALNRTMIGFSHGDNTFGWRFYPRLQTPPIEGNLQTIFRDLLVGGQGPGYALRRRRLENGIRNCVALVIMPSFVPYVDLDIHANWFRLDHPKCKELTLKQTLRMSQTVQTLRQNGATAGDRGCYRPGDTALVLNRLEQLSERLPLQHQLVSVPFENTHSGFELLSAGTTALGPELVGWYGAPGINKDGDTALFLVGNNFSVHQTRVLVGGLALDGSCWSSCATATTPPQWIECKTGGTDKASKAGQAAPAKGSACATCNADGTPADAVTQASWFSRRKSAPSANITTVLPSAPPSITIHAAPAAIPSAASIAGAAAHLVGAPVAAGAPAPSAVAPGAGIELQLAGGAVSAGAAGGGAAGAAAAPSTAPPPAAPVATPAANSCSAASLAGRVYQVELLSRQVVRVVIPRGIYFRDGMVDIHIATPYGVSPALQVPVIGAKAPTPPAAPSAFKVSDTQNAAKVTYALLPADPDFIPAALAGPAAPAGATGSFRIDWDSPTGNTLKVVDAKFTFKVAANNVEVRLPLIARDGYFEVAEGPAMGAFANALLQRIGELKRYTPDKLIPSPLEGTVTFTPITPFPPTHAVKEVPVSGKVTVELQQLNLGTPVFPPPPNVVPVPDPKAPPANPAQPMPPVPAISFGTPSAPPPIAVPVPLDAPAPANPAGGP